MQQSGEIKSKSELLEASTHFDESGTPDDFLELQKVLSAASKVEKDELRAKYSNKKDSLAEAPKEKKIDVAELMKFDELMDAVDKFEELAKETKKVEKELRDVEETREEHHGSTASLGRKVRSDDRRERNLVAIKAEVGQKLGEMIVLKNDILNKLSDIKNHELRAKIYERFERKKPDEVGMSSEVKLETKSDGHDDDLRHRALNHKAKDIIGSNLDKIAKRKTEVEKIVVETAPENAEPVVEQKAIREEEIEKAPEDHLAPGIKIGREEESEILKPEEIQTESPKDILEQKAAIGIPEQKDQPVAENKSEIEDKPSEPPVEIMEIGPDGDPVSVTDNEGEFQEDAIADDLLVDSRLRGNDKVGSGNDKEDGEDKKAESGNNKIKAEVDEVKGKIDAIVGRISNMQPEEPVRKIDDFLPPTSRIEQAAEVIEQNPDQTAASINTSEQMVSRIQPVIEPVVENNPLPEQPIQQNTVPEVKMAESDDQILTQNVETVEHVTPEIQQQSEQEKLPVQSEVQPETTIPEQKNESVQPVVEEINNNIAGANNNVIDVKPAIEARDVQIEQPVSEKRGGLFGWFGGRGPKHGAEVIANQKEVTAGDIHQILGADQEKEAA